MLSFLSSSQFVPDVTDDVIPINIASEDQNNLPHQFLDVVQQLNQNYLHWKHLRETRQATHATFYLYTQHGIKQAVDQAADAGNPIEQQMLLVLETNLALATLNSLLLAGEEYLHLNQLQNCKDSIDTALSTLHEFVKTRETLSQSQDIAIESIRQDIVNDNESGQYATYGIKKVSSLQRDTNIDAPNLYVVRQQLRALQDALMQICPDGVRSMDSTTGGRLDSLLSNIFLELVKPDDNITINRASAEDDLTSLMDGSDEPVGFFSANGAYYLRQVPDADDTAATTAKVIDVQTGAELHTVHYSGRFTAMAFAQAGQFLAIVMDSGVKVLDTATGQELATVPHQGPIRSTCFSPDGTHLAMVAANQAVTIVEVATGNTIRTLAQGTVELTKSLRFSPKGTYLAVPSEQTVKILAVATGHEVTAFPHDGSVDVLGFSADEAYIATTTGANSQITKVSTGKKITSILHQGKLWAICSSPLGTYLAIGLWDHTIKLIKVMTETGGRNIYTIHHGEPVNGVTFSEDGGYLATVSADGTANIIKVATGRRVTTITHDTDAVALAFAANRSYLATAALDGTVKLLDLPKLADEAEDGGQSAASPSMEESALVQMNKAEVFFKAWRVEQANSSSFYEFMLAQAEQGGLSVKYNGPILDTNLLLEALFFLVASAEKNYQTISPYLADLNNGELYLPALQDLRDNVSAALSSLYEFIHSRMRLDEDSYPQALERFQRDIEVDVYTSQLILSIYEKTLAFLRYEGIKRRSEFRTVKGMLDEIFGILDSLLPDEVRRQRQGDSTMANHISIDEALGVIETFDLKEDELVPLLSKLKHSGVMNSAIAMAALSKVTSATVVELCRALPSNAIDKGVALSAIRQRRKTHYIGTLMPWTKIAQREVLLKTLETSPVKTWWRR